MLASVVFNRAVSIFTEKRSKYDKDMKLRMNQTTIVLID
jgi:hypothetical protein